jgi:hypothetical protein
VLAQPTLRTVILAIKARSTKFAEISGKIAFCRESLNSHRRHASSVTIGSFNTDQLREIVKVQRFIRESFDIPHSISETADRYTQIIFDRFGLTTQAVRKIWDHKDSGTLLPLFVDREVKLPRVPNRRGSLPSVGFSIKFVGAFFRQGDRKLLLRVSHE